MTTTDSLIAEIFHHTRTIALVGASMNPARPSHQVGQYMAGAGFRIIPVNPGHAGAELFGQRVHASLADIRQPVDLVNVFRRSEAVPEIVAQTLEHLHSVRTIWMQLGIRNDAARKRAEALGLQVVEDLCIQVEHRRVGHLLRA